MSLQVWLPLDGDLRNQGLDGSKIPSLMGAGITYTEGKIGQAATFPNNCNSCIHMPGLRLQTGSFAAWLKVNGAGGSSRQCLISEGRDSYNDGVEIYTSQAGTTLYFKAHEKILSTTIELNKWYHIVGTFGNQKIQLFLNGELKSSSTYTTDMTYQYASDLTFGKMSYSYNNTSNYFAFNGKLNDVRIYNHVLSIKEIKELSKGLILHYRLSKPLPNLLSKYVSPGQANPGVTTTAGRTNYLGNYSIQIPATENADTYFRLFLTKQLIQNNKYTFSCYVSGLKEGTYYNFPFFAQGNTGMGVIHLDHNGLNTVTFTMNSSTQNAVTDPEGKTVYIMFMDDSGRSIASGQQPFQITQMKLEEGENITSFIPNETDSLYSAMGYNSNIELDCAPAGNHNDGIIVGTITAAADSPRYETSYYFNDSSYMNITNPFDANTLIKDFSISCWIKKGYSDNTSTRYIYNGIIQLYIYTDGKIRITWNHASDDLSYNSGNTWACGLLIPNNEWIHIVYTFSNGIIKVYKNGEYVSTSDRTNTGNNIRGYRGTTFNMQNSSQAFIGNVSDFRIYCTALSAEDIKELYNTAAQIDKNSNIYTYEYKEQ